MTSLPRNLFRPLREANHRLSFLKHEQGGPLDRSHEEKGTGFLLTRREFILFLTRVQSHRDEFITF